MLSVMCDYIRSEESLSGGVIKLIDLFCCNFWKAPGYCYGGAYT